MGNTTVVKSKEASQNREHIYKKSNCLEAPQGLLRQDLAVCVCDIYDKKKKKSIFLPADDHYFSQQVRASWLSQAHINPPTHTRNHTRCIKSCIQQHCTPIMSSTIHTHFIDFDHAALSDS